MNPVNATALYVSASRAVLQCDPRQPHTFAEMYKLLPFFRQSIACLVCGKHSITISHFIYVYIYIYDSIMAMHIPGRGKRCFCLTRRHCDLFFAKYF